MGAKFYFGIKIFCSGEQLGEHSYPKFKEKEKKEIPIQC